MILCSLILLFALPGLETLVITQEKAMSVKPGENVKISCRSDASRDWILAWYKQKPGQAPTFLLSDSTRASGLPSRFSYSGSGSQEYLNINSIQAEDEAVYYCACHGCEASSTVLQLINPLVQKPQNSINWT